MTAWLAQSRRAGKKADNHSHWLHRSADPYYHDCLAWTCNYIIVVPMGLASLSTEFVWAASLLKTMKDKYQ